MSDTPRTIARYETWGTNSKPTEYVRLSDYQQLERELTELKELIKTSCALCKRRYDAAAATGVGMTNAEREALHALAEALER